MDAGHGALRTGREIMSIVKVAFYADNNGNLSRSTFEMDDAGFDGELSIYGEFEGGGNHRRQRRKTWRIGRSGRLARS